MPFITACRDFLSFGYGQNIYVYSTCGDSVYETQISNPTDDEIKKNNNHSLELIQAAFSPSCKHLVVCDNFKRLFLWDTSNWKAIGESSVERKCVKILFDVSESKLLIADRSGDVFEYDMESFGAGKLVLGHLSMLLDIKVCPTGRYLITSDRDEKIRITNYPNSYNIHGYCLGHTEFVSTLEVLSDRLLISGAGDGSIRLWDYQTQQQLSVTFEKDDKNQSKESCIRKVCGLEPNTIAVLLFGKCLLKVYSVIDNSLKVKHIVTLTSEPVDMFVYGDMLTIITLDASNLTYVFDKRSLQPVSSNDLVKIVNSNETFCNQFVKSFETNEINTLFKQWFDNVEMYVKRKKEREDKEMQTKKRKEEITG